uniref:HNH endonuclease signature motif containing protein n=1 Tax=Alistipes sp. TaxID=1872444 RepID=UPI0040576B30
MINDYKEVKECVYKDEHYSVRDNGAVMRHLRTGKKARKDDGVWTFGIKNPQNGYMHFGNASGHRVHIIVATAFLGARDSKVYVVDHKDTNRCNNRVENLHWVTKLENALNNEITRNKIIYICGSIEAFVENPNILRERLSHVNEPSLEWMRTVTKEAAAVAYTNIKQFWTEQVKNPKPLIGGKMNDQVYRKQLTIAQYAPTSSNEEKAPTTIECKSDYVVSNDEWEQMTQSLRMPYPKNNIKEEIREEKQEGNYIMSQTPKAAQKQYFMSDKPCYYPNTPQEELDNPLQVYADRLVPGSVFWQNHEGKRDYIVEKRALSASGNSLIVMTKAGYICSSDGGESIEIPIFSLSNDDYNDNDLNRQLAEITYKDGVFIHKRPEVGIMPKEYLYELYEKLIKE